MIELPIWLLVLLTATNAVSVVILIIICEIICYAHDMIKFEIRYRKYRRKKD